MEVFLIISYMVNSKMIKFLLTLSLFFSSCTSVELTANLEKLSFKDKFNKTNSIYKIGNPYVVDIENIT